MKHPAVRIALIIVTVLLVAFIAIQFIPVNRTNPSGAAAIQWDSPRTQALAQRACMDCHSNETVWPWYSNVAPISWLIYYDVQMGRSRLNFSTYGTAGSTPRFPGGQSGDLAFQLGQLLAGGGEGPRGNRLGGGNLPPQGSTGQPPQGGQVPRGGFGRARTGDIKDQIQNGNMPPANYLLMHPSAKLTDQEKQQLIDGLLATLK